MYLKSVRLAARLLADEHEPGAVDHADSKVPRRSYVAWADGLAVDGPEAVCPRARLPMSVSPKNQKPLGRRSSGMENAPSCPTIRFDSGYRRAAGPGPAAATRNDGREAVGRVSRHSRSTRSSGWQASGSPAHLDRSIRRRASAPGLAAKKLVELSPPKAMFVGFAEREEPPNRPSGCSTCAAATPGRCRAGRVARDVQVASRRTQAVGHVLGNLA